jgi:hypothetical protein
MHPLIPAVLGGVLAFVVGALVSRWAGVSRRVWLPGGLVTSAVAAALIYWASAPGDEPPGRAPAGQIGWIGRGAYPPSPGRYAAGHRVQWMFWPAVRSSTYMM